MSSDSKNQDQNQDRIKRLIERAWLLSEKDLQYVTAQTSIEQLESLVALPVDAKHPLRAIKGNITPENLLRVMRNPEYFPFTCKLLLGVDIMPFQHVILRELWNRPFPMLIGSRGLGKCVSGPTLIMTNTGIHKIENFAIDAEPHQKVEHVGLTVLGENGHKDVAYAWKNGMSNNIVVKTRGGFEMENTPNHPIRAVVGDRVEWVNTENLKLGTRVVIDRSETWFTETNDVCEDMAYLFGILVGAGSYTTRSYISVNTQQIEIAKKFDELSLMFWDKTCFSKQKKYRYKFRSNEIWDELFQKYGFGSAASKEKDFPTSILQAPKASCAAFIRALFDVRGSVCEDGSIEYYSKSMKLMSTLQFVLTRFGIISRIAPSVRSVLQYKLRIIGRSRSMFAENIGFQVEKKRRALTIALSKTTSSNFDNIPTKLVEKELCELGQGFIANSGPIGYEILGAALKATSNKSNSLPWQKLKRIYDENYYYDTVGSLDSSSSVTYDLYVPEDHSFVSNGFISHNSFILGLYSILRLTFTQGAKVAIIGAAFRQSKVIFEYMEKFWADGVLLRDLCGTGKGRANREQGPRRDIDRCEMIIGDSTGIALPLGNGEKIRGQRANYIIVDEYACLGAGTLVETDRGLFRIEETEGMTDIRLNTGDERGYESPDMFIRTPPIKAYRVTTASGFSFVCSGIHQALTENGWKLGRDLSPGDILPMPSTYRFPEAGPMVDEEESLAEMVGQSVDLGGVTPAVILTSSFPVVASYLESLLSRPDFGSSLSETMARETQILLLKMGRHSSIRQNGDIGWVLLLEKDDRPSSRVVLSVEELPGVHTLYDYHLPDGHRFVANGFVQHNSVPEDIYQNVVRGFASVSADPAAGVRHQARVRLLKKLGHWSEEDDKTEARVMRSNQNVISGTAYYAFNHFYKTWKTYKAFIESCGDRKKLEAIFDGPVPDGFDWKDFSIIRMPVDMLPKGFMDEKQISSAKATLSRSNYMIEFGASFATDSEGFFKRSLIEASVANHNANIVHDNEVVTFGVNLIGEDVQHIIAVDPASERDHFSVVVLALYPSHRRLVYCWTTNRKAHKERLKRGTIKEQNFYAFCARKIRELMASFPNVQRLCIDSQGGGVTVEEALHDTEKMKEGEKPLWRIVNGSKPQDSDSKPGEHIVEMVNFVDIKWMVEANHGLRKDLEDRVLLFPAFDSAALGLAYEEDKVAGRIVLEDGEEISLFDTLEDAVMDIEELKDELSSIVHTSTASGRDRWDLPSVRLPGSRAGRQRKDRYSALLMANSAAREIQRTEPPREYLPVGGFANNVKNTGGDLYIAPEWFLSATRGNYGAAIGRDGVERIDPNTYGTQSK
jgi:intein/homing endonuclease